MWLGEVLIVHSLGFLHPTMEDEAWLGGRVGRALTCSGCQCSGKLILERRIRVECSQASGQQPGSHADRQVL